MADQILTQAQPFVITPLEGELANTDIRLEGRALPYQGVAFSTEQRISTTYYPGNPVATQQTMGPVEKNTTIKGTWKDKFLGNGQSQVLMKLFDGLMRRGTRVKIQWGHNINLFTPNGAIDASLPDETTDIVRIGLIKNFTHTYDRPQDIQWEMEFEFSGRDEPASTVLQTAQVINPKDNLSQVAESFKDSEGALLAFKSNPAIRNAAGLFPDAVNIVPLPLPSNAQLLLGNVNATIDQLQTVIDAGVTTLANANQYLNDISDALSNISNLNRDSIEKCITVCAQGYQALLHLENVIDRTPKSILVPTDGALAFLNMSTIMFDMTHTCDSSISQSVSTQKSLQGRLIPLTIDNVRAIPGTDMRELALKYYGDGDLWYLIANYNNLTSSVVPQNPEGPSEDPGYPLQIPARGNSEIADISNQCPC